MAALRLIMSQEKNAVALGGPRERRKSDEASGEGMCGGERGERRDGLRARHLRGAGERRDGLIARHVSASFSQGFALHFSLKAVARL